MLGLGGLLLDRELDCAHSCAPSSLRDTVTLAGFAIGTGRHPGVGVQAHPDIPGPAAMKSAATALPLSREGVSEHHSIQCMPQPSPIAPCPVLQLLGPLCPALHAHLPRGSCVFKRS